ncbi:L-asparaginase-like [Dendronephthya gigantea]|uniref:L-asparaginase-like n=1 Tax=Dendronephthya gigantea TaxID=151771 RepID=UPI00106A7426|nr:L-asparaginase-like [Dendronephthya gigantea]
MERDSDSIHLIRDSSHCELGKYANVLVLYTGGTIGMYGTEDGLKCRSNMAEFLKKLPMLHDSSYVGNVNRKRPDVSREKDIVELVMPLSEYGVRVFYYIKEYEQKKDSSNMQMEDWVDIALDVKNNYEIFDSFIVLHGTDTMSYTASVLSFMFQNLDKSVILTGSQVPIFEQRNDGRDNLLGALMIAGHFVIPEVTLFFHGNLYRGNRTTKINSGDFQAFDSPNLPPLATMEVKIDVHWDAIFRSNSSKQFEVRVELNPNVGVLRLFPGITDAMVESICRPPVEGVVLESFGAGNCPNHRTRFIEILKEAVERGVIIVNCTQCLKGAVIKAYETGKILSDIGIVSCSDITPEAALTKLSYILGFRDIPLAEKKRLMENNIRGEMTVAVDESQFSLKDNDFIRVIASTLRASSAKEMHFIRKALYPLLLCSATQIGHIDSVEELCKKDNVDCSLVYDDRTPLHIAAANGNLKMVQTLLEHGASLHKVDKYGATPLLDAIRFKKNDVIRLLRDSGGQVGPVVAGIATEICVAASSNDVSLLESWNLAGISLNIPNATGRTPLHEAVCALCKESVDYLLSIDVDLNMRDNLGQTAHECAKLIQSRILGNDSNIEEKKQKISAIITAFEKNNLLRNERSSTG